MTPARRIALLAFMVVIAAIAFVVLRNGDDSDHHGTVAARVHVDGGEPTGGVKVIKAGKGQRLRLTVTSDDYSGAVHLHGYDIEQELAPSRPAHVNVDLGDDGQFTIELEETGTELAVLQVSP